MGLGVWGEFSVYPTTDSVCEIVVGWYVAPIMWGHCTPDGLSLVSCTGYAVLTLMRVGFLPSRLLSPWGWGAMHPLPVVVLRVCLGAITAGKAP